MKIYKIPVGTNVVVVTHQGKHVITKTTKENSFTSFLLEPGPYRNSYQFEKDRNVVQVDANKVIIEEIPDVKS